MQSEVYEQYEVTDIPPSTSAPEKAEDRQNEESKDMKKEKTVITASDYERAPELNLGAPVSKSIDSKLLKKMEEVENAKRISHPASFRGWKEVVGYDKEDELTHYDQIMDLLTRATTLEQYLPEYLYGDWYHGIAVILVAILLCGIIGKFRLSMGFNFIVTFFAALYYRSSIRKYRFKLRLEAQREFSVHAIEDDFESMDWLNVLMDKYWVYLEPSISQQVTEIVNPMLADMEQIPAFIKSIWIHSLTLGTKPPRIDRVRTLDGTADDVTVMDWTVSMIPNDVSDTTLKQMKNRVNQFVIVKMKMFGLTIPFLVSDFSFKVNARVRLRMMSNFPHIQTINVSVTDTPDFDFIAKPIGSDSVFGFEIFKIPGLYLMVKEMTKKYLGPILFQPLSFQLNLEQLLAGAGATGALGVLELQIKNGVDLKGADTFDNTIDPYFTFGFSDKVLGKTKVVYDTINPTFNETIRIILNSSSDPLAIKLYDENVSDGRKDKFMGIALFDLEELMSKEELNNLSIPILRNNFRAGALNFDIKLMKSLVGSRLPDGSYNPPPDFNTGVAKITLLGARNFTETEEGKKTIFAEMYISGELKLKSPVAKQVTEASWNCESQDIIYDRAKCKVRVVIREDSKGSKKKIIGSTTLKLLDIIDASFVGSSWFTLNYGIGEISMSCNWNSIKIGGVSGDIGYNDPIGLLRVYIEKADDLINLEKIGVIDPYFRVLINEIQRGRTLTKDSTVHPVYCESIYIPISSVNQRVTIEGMDVERRTQDRTVGSFQIRLNEFIDYNAKGEPVETIGDIKEARLFHKTKGSRGTVTYSLSFYPILPYGPPEEIEKEKQEARELQEKIDSHEAKKVEESESSDSEDEAEKEDEVVDIKAKEPLSVDDLSNFDTGVIVITFLGSQFNTSGYFQIFFDKRGHSSFETKVSSRTNLRHTFDYVIKELRKYSVITLRVAEKPDQTLIKTTGNEVTLSTLEFLQKSYGNPTSLKVGSNIIKLKSKYLPSPMSELPPADSIGNSGKLEIEIASATELLSKDSNGKSDPFVKVYLNGEEFYETKTKKKTLEPVWNETTSVEVDSRVQSILRFKVLDWDMGPEQDDKIGEYRFPLKSIDPFAEEMKEYEFSLIGDDGEPAGTLFVKMRYYPEYHTRVSAEKSLPGAANLAVDGAGKLIGTGADGAGKVLAFGGKLGGKALHVPGAIGGLFKKKH